MYTYIDALTAPDCSGKKNSKRFTFVLEVCVCLYVAFVQGYGIFRI